MSGCLNKVMLIGRLGSDPELKAGPQGPIANLSIATSESWGKEGDRKEKTEWHRVVVFGKLADLCGDYLSKGRQVYIEGRLQTRQWEDRDGVKRYTTEVVARDIVFLGSRDDGAAQGAKPAQPAQGASQKQPAPRAPSQPDLPTEPNFDVPPDDYPF
jgi:single-strand DNA-binding protein